MPKKHNLGSPAFKAIYHAWAERWATGQDVSEAIVAEDAAKALNDAERQTAALAGREPKLVAFGVMRDRFGHLVRSGHVGTRERGDTRRSALWLNLGHLAPEEATLRPGLEAYLSDPLVGKAARDSVTSAMRFIMRPDLPNGAPALLQEAGLPAYRADRLSLLYAQVQREWRLRQEATDAGQPLHGRGPVSSRTMENHASAMKKFLVWAGVNGYVPMVGSGQGSIAWHEAIARWFGSGSGLDEATRRTYGANARAFVEFLTEVSGTDRPEPTELTWVHVDEVLDHLYKTRRPRAIQRIAHIANAISDRAEWTEGRKEIPGLPPRQEGDEVALRAERGQTPTTWEQFDAYLGGLGLAPHHTLRAFLRYHWQWSTAEITDRTMPQRRRRQQMTSTQTESLRIYGLRVWLGMACRVHGCTIQDLTVARALCLQVPRITDELATWWVGRDADDDDEYSILSSGFQTILIAGDQAMGLLEGVLLLEPEYTGDLTWLPEVREHETALRRGHSYLHRQLGEIGRRVDGPLKKNLDEIIETTGPLWWMDVRDQAIADILRIQREIAQTQTEIRAAIARTGTATERARLTKQLECKELLERAHDCFALLLIIATMGRGREYTTVRLDRHAVTFREDRRIEFLKCDTKNRVALTRIADATWLPPHVCDFFLDEVRPTLIRIGKTAHKDHRWMLLVPGTGAPLGDSHEKVTGKGKEIRVKRDEKLVTRNLCAFRQRLWCLTVELAIDAGLTLPPRRLYGALKLHAIRACMAFAAVLVHSIEIGAGLLGDTISTAERSYSALRTRHLHLRPKLIAAGYSLPNEVVQATAGAVVEEAAVAPAGVGDPFAERERELLRDYEQGTIDDNAYLQRLERIRKAKKMAAA